MLIAIFTRIKVDGEFHDWQFGQIMDSEAKAYEIKLQCEEENGPGSFYMTYLPSDSFARKASEEV